ncbi:hypothetical protein MTO96_018760 [Rhipicephalus appendiculatus]
MTTRPLRRVARARRPSREKKDSPRQPLQQAAAQSRAFLEPALTGDTLLRRARATDSPKFGPPASGRRGTPCLVGGASP